MTHRQTRTTARSSVVARYVLGHGEIYPPKVAFAKLFVHGAMHAHASCPSVRPSVRSSVRQQVPKSINNVCQNVINLILITLMSATQGQNIFHIT